MDGRNDGHAGMTRILSSMPVDKPPTFDISLELSSSTKAPPIILQIPVTKSGSTQKKSGCPHGWVFFLPPPPPRTSSGRGDTSDASEVFALGGNSRGQLGDGTQTARLAPAPSAAEHRLGETTGMTPGFSEATGGSLKTPVWKASAVFFPQIAESYRGSSF